MKMRRLLYVIMGLLLLNVQLLAQNRTISGRVTDEGGNPLSDVSVVVKGTSTGTTTKADGTYSLSVPSNARTLVFTFVGLDPMEMSIGSGGTVNAQLRSGSDQLAVVVVSVPYGTVKKTAF